MSTIAELLAARVARRPDATLLIDALTGETRSYAAVARQVRRWAAFYRQRGLRPGARVAVILPNGLDFAELYLGAALAGITLCPYNPALAPREIGALVDRFGAAIALTSASRAPDLAPVLRIPLFTVGPRGDLPAGLPEEAADLEPVPPETPLVLIMTSGTTGGVKACRISQANVCWTSARTAAAFALGPDSRYLTPLPLYHINAQVVGVLAAIQAGGAVALGPRLPAAKLWEAAARVGATGMSTVPTIIHDLLDSPAAPPPSLRFVVCSSAALPQASRQRFEDRFAVPVLVCYGLSEAGCFVSYGRPGKAAPGGSVGEPIGCEVRVADGRADIEAVFGSAPGGLPASNGNTGVASGQILDANCNASATSDKILDANSNASATTGRILDARGIPSGEILVRGPGIFAGYDGDPQATLAALRDGWLHTGDYGHFDADGHLHLEGRLKEMINRGGEKIAPDAVEAVLRDCPGVKDVAVFAMPDDRLTEEVAAAVVTEPGADLTDDGLWEFCEGRLAEFETPKVWLRPEALPRGPTGKVLRRFLQEEMARCKAP